MRYPIRCNIEIITKYVNIILGPYRIFDPTRWLKKLTLEERSKVGRLYNNKKLSDLRNLLDKEIDSGRLELGKDRSKWYILFCCQKSSLPKLRMGQVSITDSQDKLLKHISKTAILNRAYGVVMRQKSWLSKKAIILSGKDGRDKYGLSKYFLDFWVSYFLSGKVSPKSTIPNIVFSGYNNILLYISLYISRKQGWI